MFKFFVANKRSKKRSSTEHPMDNQDIFRIQPQSGGLFKRKLITAIGKPLEHIMALPELNAIYAKASCLGGDKIFMDRVLEVMNISYDISEKDLERIPKNGPVVTVANHPFGAVEGVILGSLLRRIRPDFKIMGNYFLGLIPDIRDDIIFVDNMGNEGSQTKNIRPLKEALKCLKDGHMLSIFPSGEVSSLNIRNRHISDPVWAPMVARIILKAEVPVLPIYFQGCNSALFQLLGLVHPRLRTVMLPREFSNMQHRRLHVTVGSVIPFKKLGKMQNDMEMMSYLRLRTYLLKQRIGGTQPRKLVRIPLPKRSAAAPEVNFDPIAPPVDAMALHAEIEALPEKSLLLTSGDYEVRFAHTKAIPLLLQEIGRLREMTFREVGEGTGKSYDIDRFDAYYEHLFIWNTVKREIVGAYRIGRTDKIIRDQGVEGLYTSTLFTYKPSLFESLGPALEMGRSFVRPEYQKGYAPLLLLWKGISLFILQRPKYKILFGPVSISNEYSSISKELIVRYLNTHNSFCSYSKLVKPKTPPKLKNLKRHQIREFRNCFKDMEDVTEAISDLESEFRGIPVLLKQYLKLNGKVLTFNVDSDFQNCLDGLIIVDVLTTPRRILANYMGKENVEQFHAFHENKALSEQLETTEAEEVY